MHGLHGLHSLHSLHGLHGLQSAVCSLHGLRFGVTGFSFGVGETDCSQGTSDMSFTEAFTHSMFVIILYFTLFPEKNKQRNKRFQISRFVFIPEVNNKLTTAGFNLTKILN